MSKQRYVPIALLLLLMGSTFKLHAQRDNSQHLMQRKGEKHGTGKSYGGCPRAYIGFSTGINNPVGVIGPQIDVAITPVVSIGTGVGASTWGTKTFLECRYYFKPCNRGWAVAAGFTYNTGLKETEFQDIETVAGKTTVRIEGKSQANFMFSGYHFFDLGRAHRNRFHLQLGYSIPLGEKQFTQTYGPPLTSDSRDAFFAIAPGGLIIGLGFSFGVGGM